MDIQEVLEKHKKWLDDEKGGERADLRDAYLRDADLRGADLRRANLHYLIGNLGKHIALAVGGYISIGCEYHTYENWLEHAEEIGKANNYTADEIARYVAWIKLAVELLKPLEDEIAARFDKGEECA